MKLKSGDDLFLQFFTGNKFALKSCACAIRLKVRLVYFHNTSSAWCYSKIKQPN